MAGLELAQKPLKLKFNLTGIVELIAKIEANLNVERNIAETVYKEVLKDVPVTFNSFIHGNHYPFGDCKGKIRKCKGYYEVSYYPQAFEKLIQPFTTNLKVVEESLKKAEFYLREEDRNHKRITDASGHRINVYSFKVPSNIMLLSNI